MEEATPSHLCQRALEAHLWALNGGKGVGVLVLKWFLRRERERERERERSLKKKRKERIFVHDRLTRSLDMLLGRC